MPVGGDGILGMVLVTVMILVVVAILVIVVLSVVVEVVITKVNFGFLIFRLTLTHCF